MYRCIVCDKGIKTTDKEVYVHDGECDNFLTEAEFKCVPTDGSSVFACDWYKSVMMAKNKYRIMHPEEYNE
ncbi:MAG: hypothetical protein PHW33_04730 [Candidatus Portnoybacteria bacterium]|nr:hypothetical protein [Candidatus Portnoybacteria bacterium]